ncbi:sigma-70 family RNA polymerase sigma factor [Streptomyces sp. NPDC006984]|uniref:RNA polymerase sigma factor n=1 Tax=Streptomyces sp. NPDC006984 TaxID=3155463 RepID=UPI0033D89F39
MEDSPLAMPDDGLDLDILVQRFKDLVGIDVTTAIPVVYGQARKLSRGDPHAAGDLAQDVWAHICKLLRNNRLPDVEHPHAFLRRLVLRQRMQDIRRDETKKRSHQSESLEQKAEAGYEPGCTMDGPEDIAIRADLERRLHEATEELPPRLRAVVALRIDGHTHAEIARILDIPVNTSKNRLRTALDHLRGNPGLAGN